VTAVAISANHDDQSIDLGTAHSHTPSRVSRNVRRSVTLEVRL